MRPTSHSRPAARVLVLSSPPLPDDLTGPWLDERSRRHITRLRVPADAARHATGRLLARLALARMSGRDLTQCAVTTGADGRPLAPEGLDLCLSISHAGPLVLAAAGTCALGIDTEHPGSLAPLLAAPEAFCPGELDALADRRDQRAALRRAARWWTAKEACLKAVGVGLFVDPGTVDARDETVRVPGHRGRGPTDWRVHALQPPPHAPGHVVTLAVPDTGGAAAARLSVEHLTVHDVAALTSPVARR